MEFLYVRQMAQTIVDKGGDYVMIVKDNQPTLKEEIELVLTLPLAGDRQESARTVDGNQGVRLVDSPSPCSSLSAAALRKGDTSTYKFFKGAFARRVR